MSSTLEMTCQVLLVDDDPHLRQALSQTLDLAGFQVSTRADAQGLAAQLPTDWPGVVVSDIRMPGLDGLQLLEQLQQADPQLPVILITGHGDVPMAVEAMRVGAYDFLEKPFNPDRMTELAKRATQARRLTLDNRALRKELSDGSILMKKLIGSSPVMERLREDILDLGQADSHVLIDGETGTGKTLVAHALHAVGPRASKKFVTISCAAWSEDQLAAKLFGPSEDGQIPLVEEARGGTLCLEDIESLSHGLQSRLLTFINDQGTPPETRIIAICNEHAPDKTLQDVLRSDLFYRLGAMTIICPPLRARGEDVLTMFNRAAEAFAEARSLAQRAYQEGPNSTAGLFAMCESNLRRIRRGGKGRDWVPFAAAIGMFVLAFFGLAYSVYPYLVIDQIEFWDAAAAPGSLKIILVGALVTLPMIIGYTIFAYRVFWGRSTELSYE